MQIDTSANDGGDDGQDGLLFADSYTLDNEEMDTFGKYDSVSKVKRNLRIHLSVVNAIDHSPFPQLNKYLLNNLSRQKIGVGVGVAGGWG